MSTPDPLPLPPTARPFLVRTTRRTEYVIATSTVQAAAIFTGKEWPIRVPPAPRPAQERRPEPPHMSHLEQPTDAWLAWHRRYDGLLMLRLAWAHGECMKGVDELPGFALNYGIRVVRIGEDDEGDLLVALGHHSERRALAAFSRYCRLTGGEPQRDTLQQTYARLVGECGGCPSTSSCAQCETVRTGGWWIEWDIDPAELDAFPVTLMDAE